MILRAAYTATMQVTVRLLGPSADAMGASSVSLAIEGEVTCASLRTLLAERAPAIEPFLRAGRFAVNHTFASESQRLRDDDEVALISMVSGG